MADRIASDAEIAWLKGYLKACKLTHNGGAVADLLLSVLARLAAAEKVVEAARKHDCHSRDVGPSLRSALVAYVAARKEAGNAW